MILSQRYGMLRERAWKIVVDGDSNTANGSPGWYGMLQTMLVGYGLTFGTNFAVSGSAWVHGTDALSATFRQSTVNAQATADSILILGFNTNDAAAVSTGQDLVDRTQTYVNGTTGYTKIVVLEPPPLSLDATNNAKLILYRQRMTWLDRVHGIVRLPPQLLDSANLLYFEADGIHYTALGWQALALAILQTLEYRTI